ncbi:MAG: FAD-binding oxidoreductase [Gemmatimonadaceae bacterium]
MANGFQRQRDVIEIGERIKEAAAERRGLRIVGAGHWLSAGRPVAAVDTLDLSASSGVVDYNPGDLTLTALAATPLDEIARVARAERQWLAFDPMGEPGGTIGATISTGSAGPLAHAFGTPRDNVLGLDAVTGNGQTISAGGRVVKNVAGFDLTRLLVGSWGTLGAITSVTVRLRGIPEADETYSLAIAEDVSGLEWIRRSLGGSSFAPWAVEVLNRNLSRLLGIGDHLSLLVRIAGSGDSVRSQSRILSQLGDLSACNADVWRALARCEPSSAVVLRLSRRPSRVTETWAHAQTLPHGKCEALTHASVGRGVVRCMIPFEDGDSLANLVTSALSFSGTCIFERLPASAWKDVPSSVAGRLSSGIRRSFDPCGILNPGILGAAT